MTTKRIIIIKKKKITVIMVTFWIQGPIYINFTYCLSFLFPSPQRKKERFTPTVVHLLNRDGHKLSVAKGKVGSCYFRIFVSRPRDMMAAHS